MNVPRWTIKVLALTLAGTCLSTSSEATSLIIAFEKDRIILVADSRASEIYLKGAIVHDDKCKIVILGDKFGFAETGNEGYTRSTPSDPVPAWHGTSEALKAYNQVIDHNVHDVAKAWGIQVSDYFQLFFLADPQRVRSLTNQENLNGTLLVGIFVGSDNRGILRAYAVRIALDDSLQFREPAAKIPIGYAVDELQSRDGPYSTDAITQELLDGKTQRAIDAAAVWAKKSRHLPKKDRELRRLQFLIERTSDFDKDVHGPVNVLQIFRDSVNWFQNITCQGSNL